MEFILDCQPNLMLQADSLRLQQILVNLLDNARKYSMSGATIVLKGMETEKRNSY